MLVVWTLDRLSRSLRDVLTIMERVQERHAGFRSLKEAVDTTTPAGRMMMQMVGAFAEFERAMLKERTKAGLDAARKEGRIGGRPPKLKPHQQQEIVTLVKQGKKTAADAARLFGVHPATVSRLLRRTWIESSTVLSVPLLPKPQLGEQWLVEQIREQNGLWYSVGRHAGAAVVAKMPVNTAFLPYGGSCVSTWIGPS